MSVFTKFTTYFIRFILREGGLFLSNNSLKEKAGNIVFLQERLHGQLLHSRKGPVFHDFTPGDCFLVNLLQLL